MSLPKLGVFAIVAAIFVFAGAGGFTRSVEGFDISTTNALPQDPLFAAPSLLPTQSYLPVQSFLPIQSLIPIQSRNPKNLAAGKLLVASRNLGDPNFAGTVILLVHYNPEGVLGLVLNRRTHVPVSQVLEDLKAAKDRSEPVYIGGPVDTEVVFGVVHAPAKVEGAEHISDGLYLISAKTQFEQIISTRPDAASFRVYLGYAGWNAEQLRKEVEVGAWFIFPGDEGTVFNENPDSLWREMIRKTEMEMARSVPASTYRRTQSHLLVE